MASVLISSVYIIVLCFLRQSVHCENELPEKDYAPQNVPSELIYCKNCTLPQNPVYVHLVPPVLNQSYPFRYVLNPPNACATKHNYHLKYIVAVHSFPENIHQRNAIRRSWASKWRRSPEFRVLFFMGSSLNRTTMGKVIYEAWSHKDIVQEDFISDPANQTLISVMMLRWFTIHCRNTEFVLKVRDDTYVNVYNLVRYYESFRNMTRDHSVKMFGKMVLDSNILENISANDSLLPEEEFPFESVPPFLCGVGYMMTGDSVSVLYDGVKDNPLFGMEDLYVTAVLANDTGVRRASVREFGGCTDLVLDHCYFTSKITGPHVEGERMLEIWRNLNNECTLNQCFSRKLVDLLKAIVG